MQTNNKVQDAINKLFLDAVEKAAYSVLVPEKGYEWMAEYDGDLIILSYTDGDKSCRSCYIDIVNKVCINHDNNHDIMICKVADLVMRMITGVLV